ncbi:MAG: pyridoxal phosphate-dependent aminotransferase [Bryobacteraceae bacterium]
MRFSSRFHWDLGPNRIAQRLAGRRRAGLPVLDLTESNPTRAGLAYPPEVIAALADARSLAYDPQPAGAAEAREAVAAYYGGVPPGRILLTASTSEGYAYLFKLLTDPGDEVLAPRPSYPLFEFLAAMESVRVAQYPLFYHGEWSIDFDSLEGAITPRTRAVVVVNPNNPTGSFLKTEELERLRGICRAHDLAIISDEVFADYGHAPDARRVRTLAHTAGAFAMSGLSKIAGLPQMKLGWIVAPAEAMEKLELIADTYLSVSTPVQHAASRLLAAGAAVGRQIMERVTANLAHFRGALGADSPLRILTVEGGWYAIVQAPRTRSEEQWTLDLLDEDGVLVQPGYFFDFESEAYLVVSLLTRPEVFEEGIRRLVARVR